jgi:hypothetical protein
VSTARLADASALPEGLTVEHVPGGVVYRWSVLPRKPMLLAFFALLGAVLVLPGPLLLLADLFDRLDVLEGYFRGAEGVWIYGLFMLAFTIKAGPFFAVALLGRCRLTIGPETFDYEVTLLGRRLRSHSRRLPAREVVGLAIKDPTRGGIEVRREGGKPFYLKLPVGAGALSMPELIRLKARWLADMGVAAAVLLAVAAGIIPAAEAGDVVIGVDTKREKRQKDDPPGSDFYRVTVINQDQVRRATRVVLRLAFQDKKGNEIGHISPAYDVRLDPDRDTKLRVECAVPLCRAAGGITVVVESAEFEDIDFGTPGEIALELHERRFFLENRWDTDKTAILRSFSKEAFPDAPSDGKVFPPGLGPDPSRFYRVAREEVPGGFAKEAVNYEIDYYTNVLLPGIKIEDGQKKKPGFLDTDVVGSETKGHIAVGEIVQIKQVRLGGKDIVLVIAPLCDLVKDHRLLRGVLKFVIPRERLKGPDHDFIEAAVQPWLEPIPIAEATRTCSPTSGTPVRTWTAATTLAEVEADLGPADARAQTAKGEVFVYGGLRLRFEGGKLAGVEKRKGS